MRPAILSCSSRSLASRGAYLLVLTGIPNAIRRIGDILRLAVGRADRPWMSSPRAPLRSCMRRGPTWRPISWWRRHRSPSAPLRSCSYGSPWVLGQAFLRPYLLAEHTACATTRDCLENTRTTLTMALVRLFAWNMPYHAEHHAYPACAVSRLTGAARARARAHRAPEPGYVAATVTVNRFLFAGGA
jgi:hypothetical protein